MKKDYRTLRPLTTEIKTSPVKQLVMRFLHRITHPFCLSKLRDGKNTVTLTKDGSVVISDGKSTDAIPAGCVSPELLERFTADLKWWGYA